MNTHGGITMTKNTTSTTTDGSFDDVLTAIVVERIPGVDIRTVVDERDRTVSVRFAIVRSTTVPEAELGNPETMVSAVHALTTQIENEYAEAFEKYLAEREDRLRAAVDQMAAEREQFTAELGRQRKIIDKLVGVES